MDNYSYCLCSGFIKSLHHHKNSRKHLEFVNELLSNDDEIFDVYESEIEDESDEEYMNR